MDNKKAETSSLFLYSLRNESRKYVYGGSQVIEKKRREQFGYTVIPIKDEGL